MPGLRNGKDYLKKLKKRVNNRLNKYYNFRWRFPRAYRKEARKPVQENKIVFVEIRLPELTNSFKVLYDRIAANYDFEIHAHFLRNTFVKKVEYDQRCEDAIRDIATAKYVFLNEGTNAISSVKIRPETIVTQTWHGCGAFKKFGFSTADLIFGGSRKEQLRFPFYKNYTYLTLSSPEICWAYEEAMCLQDRKEVIKPIGTSRTDIFYDQKFIEASFRKLHDYMPESEGKKVILYAPTFRGRVANAETPDMLSVPLFSENLSDEYVLLFKHHPLVKHLPEIPQEYEHFAQDVTDSMSIEELLAVSDICISDYSSLIFEYSLYERPMIFFSYDLSEYFDWRGFYYNYEELTPGPTFSTNMEMIDYIQNIDTRFDKQRVIDFRNKFMSACDGHATERIMELVFGDALEKHKRSKPLDGEFHMVPKVGELYSKRVKRIQMLADRKKEFTEIYKREQKKPVQQKKVILLQIPGERSEALSQLGKRLGEKSGYTVTERKAQIYGQDACELIAQLAAAETIVVAKDCEMLNLLDIRPETRVVQIWDQVLPFEKFGCSSKEVISGYNRDYMEVAPIHRNYTLAAVSSEQLIPIYGEAFGMSDQSRIKPLGTAATDVLFDPEYGKKSREKIEKLFPEAKEKKILFYLPEERISLTRPTHTVFVDFKLMREFLKDQYVMVFDFDPEMAEELPQYKYFGEFMYNIRGKMTTMDAMAAADVMIGDYREEIFSFAALDRPLYLYVPDMRTHFYESDVYVDYENIAPGPIYTQSRPLIDAIRNEEYDTERRNHFREKYLSKCDGHVIDRIIKEI